jgi:hypothetical protein
MDWTASELTLIKSRFHEVMSWCTLLGYRPITFSPHALWLKISWLNKSQGQGHGQLGIITPFGLAYWWFIWLSLGFAQDSPYSTWVLSILLYVRSTLWALIQTPCSPLTFHSQSNIVKHATGNQDITYKCTILPIHSSGLISNILF